MFGIEHLETRRMFAGGSPPPNPVPDPPPAPYQPPEVLYPLPPGAPVPQHSGTLLRVLGTSGADQIDVWADYGAGLVRVWVNGSSFAYPFTAVTNVQVEAGKGNDIIYAEIIGYRQTTVSGGDGDDWIEASGYGGRAEFRGENGRDTLSFATRTYAGVNIMVDGWAAGAPGGEHLAVSDDTEEIIGTGLADTLSASSASRPHTLRGGGGADDLVGGRFGDGLFGDDGFDTINGGAGDDYIDGGEGWDVLRGEAGNDTLIALDHGHDYVDGGADIDTALVSLEDIVVGVEHVWS